MDEALDRVEVTAGGLVGTFFSPRGGSGPTPGVLIVSGSEGGLYYAEFWAAHIASLGYPALGLAYFGMTGLPTKLSRIPLEYFGTALEWLANRPEVEGSALAVAGTSRGGELALMLGAYYPQVRAVYAEVPSAVRWGAVGTTGAAWTVDSEDLPYLTSAGTGAQPAPEKLPTGGVGYRMTPLFETGLAAADATSFELATIAVEEINGPVVLIASADDGVWPSCSLSTIAMDRLVGFGHNESHGDVLRCYPDAGHLIGVPGWPTTESYTMDGGSYTLVARGTPAGTARAQRDADHELRELLAALAAQGGP